MSELNYKDMRIVSHKAYEALCRQNKELWETMKMIKEGHFTEMDALKIAVDILAQRHFSSALDLGFFSQFPTFKKETGDENND